WLLAGDPHRPVAGLRAAPLPGRSRAGGLARAPPRDRRLRQPDRDGADSRAVARPHLRGPRGARRPGRGGDGHGDGPGHDRNAPARPARVGDLDTGAGRAAPRGLGHLRIRAEAAGRDAPHPQPVQVKRRRGPTRKRPGGSRLNVLVTVPFAEPQLERLRRVSSRLTVTQAKPETADYTTTDVLYAVTLPHVLSRAPKLSWVQAHMAGVNGLYEHPIYANRAITLTTASGVHAATVAEYAMTTLLALAHRVPRMVEWQGKGVWPPDEQRWPLFVPTPVRGATLGVIGYGSIGRELARITKTAFAMTVLACKRDPKRRADPGYCPPGTGDPAGALPDEWFSPERLDALLACSDVVVMCAPLTRETHHMIGARELRAMKPTAYFLNVGRGASGDEKTPAPGLEARGTRRGGGGGSVDENALAQALKERRIAGAAVDVFAQEPPPSGHPLYAVDNVIVSPHVSGFVATYDDDCCRLFAENLRRRLAGTPLLNLVDRAKGYYARRPVARGRGERAGVTPA